jgi:3-phenylpropionate/trans-cinnamate dioxygenase ferredoxin subunit
MMMETTTETGRWVEVAAADEIAEGEAKTYDVEGERIAIARAEGRLFAVQNVCSHDDGPLGDGAVDGYCIVCPRHGAKFDVRTGEALTMPAVSPIESFPVKEEAGKILLGLPEKLEGTTVIEDGSW